MACQGTWGWVFGKGVKGSVREGMGRAVLGKGVKGSVREGKGRRNTWYSPW